MSTFDILGASFGLGLATGIYIMIHVLCFLIKDGQLKQTEKWFKK